MDTTTIVALFLVVAGPIALYFLRRGNVRSNGQFIELADYIKVNHDYDNYDYNNDTNDSDILCLTPCSQMPCNIWYTSDDDYDD
jgi:hypothetical protein